MRKFLSCPDQCDIEERAVDELMGAATSISELILLLTVHHRATAAIVGLELTKILQEVVVRNHDLLAVPKNISGEVQAIYQTLFNLPSSIVVINMSQCCLSVGTENENDRLLSCSP